MKRTQFSVARVGIISAHLQEVIHDLRLVDVADYIAFIRCELFGNIADIVNSATELTFYPEYAYLRPRWRVHTRLEFNAKSDA